MITVIGLCGSLRHASYNALLLRSLQKMMPADVDMCIASIEGIPLYDYDEESGSGVPEPVARLKDALAAADGLMLASPEYNRSLAGVAKNAIDWLSRPDADSRRVFGAKAVGLAGASPGGFGTVSAQNAWLPVFQKLGSEVWPGGPLLVSAAHKAFDTDGALTDTIALQNARTFIDGFSDFLRARKARAA